ncbi:hypothetical protein [Gleimia coleocanis]|uniref:hypothetical protein n=1 Tax=Gleimia coleocanis TaxID=103618 RepID=UPI00031C809E|nr:hypothetical protein [Gleimia coleocanis]
MTPNTQKTCATATHEITEADLEAGEFTPTLQVTALENSQEVQTVTLPTKAISLPNKHVRAKTTGFTPHNFNPNSIMQRRSTDNGVT